MSKLIKLLAKNRRPAQPRAFDVQGEDVTIYIYDAIVADDDTAEWWGGVSAQTLVPQIRGIKGGTVHLRINSPGGDVFAAQAIVAAIRDTGVKVVAHIDGVAASAATVIASAADEVEMSDGAMYMIHCAWTVAIGNSADLAATSALLDKTDGVIAGQYAKRSGKSADDMKALMTAETWFTAEEAVEIGLADRVAENAPRAQASWDLSAYANAPKPQANAEPEHVEAITAEHRERQQQRMRMLNRINHQ
ncbi:head maturation protease, ClpP-related [Paraburkholderia kirstenboschensis]|uniref:ATP-dependent Clp protease proteolytic subunit n=1 Tax=Paraburkholderia kirstenboschensis TaxID=1245436 RepID=A0ABZ0ETT7_9BURK|nr:head maturation protease, ClpP-related [Paraburkholderia kirstenboschensis]WOD19832.1 Clp protease ClpP [Paraburkholderia kirstenboschensis]